jgi:hypothetical protein
VKINENNRQRDGNGAMKTILWYRDNNRRKSSWRSGVNRNGGIGSQRENGGQWRGINEKQPSPAANGSWLSGESSNAGSSSVSVMTDWRRRAGWRESNEGVASAVRESCQY